MLKDLLAQIRELELVARKNATSVLSGAYQTSIPGRGLDFREARRYVQGESIRQIDWKITARLREPHVRTFFEEREREIFLALDVSPSMRTGWQSYTKLELAVELAATLAVSARAAGDRLGLLTFDDRVRESLRPRRGGAQLHRVLAALVGALRSPSERGGESRAPSDMRAALHGIQRLRGKRFVVFLLSDFLERDLPEDLRFVRRRHDVSLFHVYDPVEYATGASVLLPLAAPEGSLHTTVARPGELGRLDDLRRLFATQAEANGILTQSFSTAEPAMAPLRDFLSRKAGRLAR